MTLPFHLPLFALGVLLGACGACAAESTPIFTDPAPVPANASAEPTRSRAVSREVAGLLASAAPKYTAPAATDPPPVPPEPREMEKPRNGIIRLSPYVVRETKVEFKERDVLTAQGRLDLALKRHPGLRFGSIGPFKNDTWAHALLEEEFGIERQKEMYDLLSLLPGPGMAQPIFSGRPPFSTPFPASGPWAGLVVPWERK